MCVLNDIDRFHLAIDVIDRACPTSRMSAAHFRQQLQRQSTVRSLAYYRTHGEDMPEVREWKWPG